MFLYFIAVYRNAVRKGDSNNINSNIPHMDGKVKIHFFLSLVHPDHNIQSERQENHVNSKAADTEPTRPLLRLLLSNWI